MADKRSPDRSEDILRSLADRRAATTVTAADDAVRDHLVHNVPVLPGVFLLDLVLRVVRQSGVDPARVELRRITFLAPVLGTEAGRRIEVLIGRTDDGAALPVTVRSRPLGPGEEWETNCRAELHPADPDLLERSIDPGRLTSRATRVVGVDELYGFARQLDIVHRGFMKASGLVHVGRDHALAEMRLAAEAGPYLSQFHAHPAVLDFATLVPLLLFQETQRSAADHAFIPLYVDSFHATGGIGPENLVHVPGPVGGRLDADLFEADLEICSPDGRIVARLGGFRAKRVRSADLITGRRGPVVVSPTGGEPVRAPQSAGHSSPDSRATGLRETIATLVAAKLGRDADDIDPERGFYDLGLTSLDLLDIAGSLEDGLGTQLYPTLLFEYPTVSALVDHLRGSGHETAVGEVRASAPATSAVPDRATPVPSVPWAADVSAHPDGGPLAIVGLAGRYPGAATAEALWGVLREGADHVTGIPADRWDHTPYFDEQGKTPGRGYGKWGAFCDGAADFDAPFFHLADTAAAAMDPHERLFLQTAWEALEDAGHTPESLGAQTDSAVGVFAGAMWNDYQLNGLDRLRQGGSEVVGSWSSALTNRVSYTFDFKGPSLTVDTACSAALTALHLAVASIRRGECRAAVVGGVNLSLHPYKYLRLGDLGLLSPTGRCRPFGKGADGYVPGEGVGAVVIRPLADALASGDHIHGLIRGSALRHSGRTGGYAVPSPDAQARVVSAALADAGVPAGTIGYVEAHASSTTLGDRIEVEALTSVYGQQHGVEPGSCAIGSVKGGIGHLEAAAGMAGLTKLLLALRYRMLLASPDIGEPNPDIQFEKTPFYLPERHEPWSAPVDPATGATVPRRAALSAFGAGGANVHVVIEEFEQSPAAGAPSIRLPRAVPLSAQTEEQVRQQAGRLAMHLRSRPDLGLDEVAHTLRIGRRPMEHRFAVVVSDCAELAEALEDFAQGRRLRAAARTGRVRPGGSTPPVPSGALDEATLAERWTSGATTGWPVIDGAVRVPLPTYPFARRRYWIGSVDPQVPQAPALPATPSALPSDAMLYAPRWLPAALPIDTPGPFADAVVLAFDTDDTRVAGLRSLCGRVVQVRPGMAYARVARDTYEIQPGDEEHYRALASELHAEGTEPAAALHLWALGAPAASRTEDVGGLLSVLRLCRAWALGRTGPLAMVYGYTCEEESPANAAVGGFARSVRLEQPKLALKTVGFDTGRASAATVLAEAADALAKSTASAAGPVWTGGESRHTTDGRRVLGFIPMSSALPDDGETEHPPLARPGGTYLISGGAGALGLHTARLLARTAEVSIALIGRSAAGADTDAAVAELKALGARALYVSADLTDRDATGEAVRTVTERLGALTGVIHAAGVVDDALLVNKATTSFAKVLDPKVRGTVHLDAATSDQRLDYFLLYSSVAAVLGNAGATDYAAANRYLDSFATWRDRLRHTGSRSGRTLAVNWPLWRDGGMHIDPAVQDRVLARTGSRPLETEEGLAALKSALASDETQVVVLCGERNRLERHLGVITPSEGPPEPTGIAQGEEPAAAAMAYVGGMVAELLREAGAAPAGGHLADTGFMELGLSSIQIVDLVQRLSDQLSAYIQPTVLFRHTDVRSLARYLVDEHSGAVADLLAAETGAQESTERQADAPSPSVTRPIPGPGDQPIAIIGMAGRFPGSAGTSELWTHLVRGHDLVTEVPADRWDHRLYHDPTGTRPSGTDCGHGAFLDDVARFDAHFFGVPRAEAEGMDPQSRLLLEVLYEAAEDAGVAGVLRGSATGMFVGRCFSDYDQEMAARDRLPGAHDVTGTSVSMAANRASYTFDLTGPSMVVDTACSSSLYALHLAVNALRRGECEMAYAAGTNLILSPQHYLRSSALGALSPSGRCHTFDARADGYVPGEAVTAVILKPLDRAIADGDPVHAVIRAVAVNHGGSAASVTAPHPARQAALLLSAWKEAGIDPETLTYLEAHGTGTSLGDPVEVEAAAAALRQHTGRKGFCALGSAKAHLGHTEGAAGLVGVVKTVLSMRHRVIPAMPSFETPNPYCDLDDSPLFINTEAMPWEPAAGAPCRAGVSSFGFGGAYAHAVIEEPPARSVPGPSRGPLLFPFSARDERALRELVGRHRDFLADHPGIRADRVAVTLRRGREEMECRIAVLADSLPDLLHRLATYLGTDNPTRRLYGDDLVRSRDPELAEAARQWTDGLSALPPMPGADDLPRLSLPTYPFTGERYWFEEDPALSSRADADGTGLSGDDGAAPVVSAARDFVLRSGFSGDRASRGMDRLDDLLRSWSRHLLSEGLQGGAPTAARLRERLADEERYGRLADALAAMIGRAPSRPGHRYGTPEETERLHAEAVSLAVDHPELKPWVDLVTVCVPRLPEMLTGETDPLDVFFAEDTPDLLLRIYDGNAVADHHNEIVARIVSGQARALRERRAGQPVRLLEIGGGTGGTTRRLLDELGDMEAAVRYTFTDVSPGFLPAARSRFAGTPVTFECRVLDLDSDPEAQGFEPGSVDIVIAANSVHATRDMAGSLSRIRRLLAPGGIVVLEELVRNRDCMTAMIGALPGYWSSVDPEVRLPHSPFLDVAGWRRAMAEQGFGRTWALGSPDLDESAFDNAVLIGEVRTDLPHGDLATTPAAASAPSVGKRSSRVVRPVGTPKTMPSADAPPVTEDSSATTDATTVRVRLRGVFARFFGRAEEDVDTAAPFDDYGMDSLSAIQLVRMLEPEFGKLPKVLLYEHTSIDSLAEYLSLHAPGPNPRAEPEENARPAGADSPVRQPAQSERPVPTAATSPPSPSTDPIAIVGMAGRFAKSPDLMAWWRNLRDGVHLVSEIPAERFDWREFFGDPHREEGKVNSRWGSFIDGVDRFDAEFFGMTPLEAELMDPQQRIMLETAWKAVEDSGHRPSEVRGSRTGVFVGATSRDYDWQLQRAGRHREGHVVSGGGHCLIANRVSYQLDLRGPSEAVDTACSSSLTALHRGVRAVQTGECDAAIVGGVHLFLTPDLFVALGQLGILSPDGRCAAFDRRANGMVRGEGAVAVVIKPLSKALADGDTVHALVRGSGVSHGGGDRKDSLMMPSPTAQADLIASVYRGAGVDPRSISYIEAHGTGTEVGDPIEVRGLRKAFAEVTGAAETDAVRPWCALGTVKSNVGHTEAAAGLTGVVKTVLAMRNGMLPPTLHFTEPNPLLDLEGSPFSVVDRLTPWEASDAPRRAGVSAFGLGGTNAHVLLEDHPQQSQPTVAETGRHHVVPLSARTGERLSAYVRNLHDFLRDRQADEAAPPPLEDIAYTLTVGRDSMGRRLALVASTTEELLALLRAHLDGVADAGIITGPPEDSGHVERAAAEPATESGPHADARRWVADGTPLRPLPGRRVPLPTYPFAAQRHWVDAPNPRVVAEPRTDIAPEADEVPLPEVLRALSEGRISVEQAEQSMEGVL
ncbi:SDR family NAD(P)-dependent oxidoreductase [Streptomyces microflavus]|uniref:SDR family NAD(P)-dependent oxidoreductase n=2 Tax=Streptomyces microflavus TaxID=1919 RepID=UPI0033C6F8E5